MINKLYAGMAIAGITEKMFLDVSSYIAVISDMVVKNNCYDVAPKLIEGLRKILSDNTDMIYDAEAKKLLTSYIESYIKLVESGIDDTEEVMKEAIIKYDESMKVMKTYFIGLCQ